LPLIAAIWAAAIAIIQPRGNFPIQDDWDFALATWRFAETGQFHFTQFTVVSLRAMVLWGAAWTRLFGQSFNVLRASTLLLSLATLLIVNRTIARAGVPLFPRMVATLALLFHPIFLWASCTYMTDVPFVFATAVALYFFATDRPAAGCVAVLASCFIRQNGIVFLAVPLLQRKRSAVVAAVVFVTIALLRPDWLSGNREMFAVHAQMWTESTFRLPQQLRVITDYLLFNAQNSALFFLPLTLPLLWWRPKLAKWWAVIPAIVILRLATLRHLWPYDGNDPSNDILAGNVVFDWGIGTPLLTDTFTLNYPYPFRLAVAPRVALTALGAALAIALIAAVACGCRLQSAFDRLKPVATLGSVAAIAGTVALFASGYYYDRYSLDSAWAVVLALPLVVPWEKRAARIASVAALIAIACFSTFMVQEHFAWQRARWQAWGDLRARGVAVNRIDGGGEAFAFYELRDAPRAVARRGHALREYVIAFRNLPGYRVIARYPFGWLRRGEIVSLQKVPSSS
jgi:hypothetical protein